MFSEEAPELYHLLERCSKLVGFRSPSFEAPRKELWYTVLFLMDVGALIGPILVVDIPSALLFGASACCNMAAVLFIRLASFRGEGAINSRWLGGTGVEKMVLTVQILPSQRLLFRDGRDLACYQTTPIESVVLLKSGGLD